MQEFWSEYMELVSGTFAVLMFAYLSLLLSWPAFIRKVQACEKIHARLQLHIELENHL